MKKRVRKNKKEKSARQLERHMKGVANHHRIAILLLIEKSPGLTLEEISDVLKVNMKTISGHTYRLVQAGLLNKKYQGLSVAHSLSPYGKIIADFLISFSYSRE
jgi:predicted transcriptional regulator